MRREAINNVLVTNTQKKIKRGLLYFNQPILFIYYFNNNRYFCLMLLKENIIATPLSAFARSFN